MAYQPLWRIKWYPADDLDGTPTYLNCLDGNVVADMFEPVRSCDLHVPATYDEVLDDFASYSTEPYQRGQRIVVEVAEDGDFDGALVKVVFDGFIHEIVRDPVVDDDGLHQDYTLHCLDAMAKSRVNGLNMSRQTRMLRLSGTFTSADFSSDDPNFLVNIPCDTLEAGYEFVPQLMVKLYCEYDEGGDDVTAEYKIGEDFSYGAGSKIIYFHESQAVMKAGSGTWHWELFYYDPDDDSNSVKNLLLDIAIGDSHSEEGGLALDSGEIDLEEITGFGGDPKLVRSFVRERPDGPINQALDDLRESGLLPYNYWLRIDPADRMLRGEYVYQVTGSDILEPTYGVLGYSHSTTIEGVFGIVEVYTEALTPRNFATGASVSINCPAGYTVVLTGADGSETVDGRVDTFTNFQYTAKIAPDYTPHSTDVDAFVYDIGEVRTVKTIMLRLAQAWSDGLDGPHRVYLIERHPKITVSMSESPISDANPGIPVSNEAIGYECDYENPEQWITLECEHITKARYVAVMWEQDAFFRNSTSPRLGGHAERTSVFALGEIKILGDSRFRYDKIIVDGTAHDHPDKGRVPYAEIKGVGDVTTVDNVASDDQFTLTDTGFAEIGDFIQVKADSSDPVLCYVADKSGDEIRVEPPVPGVQVDDPVGEYNRWMLGFDGLYYDLYYPKTRLKLANTTECTEIIDSEIAEIEDAESAALERVLESIEVTSDHRMEIPLDIAIDISNTVRPYSDEEQWMVTRCRYNLNPVNSQSRPAVTQELDGTNYEAVPQ